MMLGMAFRKQASSQCNGGKKSPGETEKGIKFGEVRLETIVRVAEAKEAWGICDKTSDQERGRQSREKC